MAFLTLMKPVIDRPGGLPMVVWREPRPHGMLGVFEPRLSSFCRAWVSFENDTYWLNYYDSSAYFTAVVRPWLLLTWLVLCAAALTGAVHGVVDWRPVWLVVGLLVALDVMLMVGRIWSTPGDHRAAVREDLAVRLPWDGLSEMHSGHGRQFHPQGLAPLKKETGEPVLIVARFGRVDSLVLSLSMASEEERDNLQLVLEGELIGARDQLMELHRRAQAAAT